MRRHFMPLTFLSARHGLGLYVLLNVRQEGFGRLERGNVVGGNFDGRVLRNVTARFLRAGFDDETAKTSEVNVLTGNHVVFNDIHKRFYGRQYNGLFQTRLGGDFGYNFCFCQVIL